jgi:hypothetical protein
MTGTGTYATTHTTGDMVTTHTIRDTTQDTILTTPDIITTTTLHVRHSIHTQVTSLTISLEATDIAI